MWTLIAGRHEGRHLLLEPLCPTRIPSGKQLLQSHRTQELFLLQLPVLSTGTVVLAVEIVPLDLPDWLAHGRATILASPERTTVKLYLRSDFGIRHDGAQSGAFKSTSGHAD